MSVLKILVNQINYARILVDHTNAYQNKHVEVDIT